MTKTKKHIQDNGWRRRLMIFPPIILGVGLVLGATLIKKPPQKVKTPEKPVSVRILEISKTTIIPRTRGYGVVRPSRIWQGVAKVAGPIASLHPKLQSGAIFKKGDQLVIVEPAEYQLALDQLDAEQEASKAKVVNNRELLKIEKRNAALLKEDLNRQLTLKKRGATTQVAVDKARRNVLSAQTKLQGLQNNIKQLAADQKVLKAKRAVAALHLERTVIDAPFDLRIAEVLTEKTQFANKGQVLVKADGIATMEVTAHIPMGRLRYLVKGTGGAGWLLSSNQESTSGPLKLKANVRSRRPHGTVSWPGRVSRIAQNLDPQTQTVGIIVTIEDPYATAIPGIRPILVPNTFVEVELQGKPLKDQIIVPASALHEGNIYILNDEQRLIVRPVKIKFRQGNLAVVASGLIEGERLILSDLVPVIKGMLLKPTKNKDTLQTLGLETSGKAIEKKPKAEGK